MATQRLAPSTEASYAAVERCRVCSHREFSALLSLGKMPLANAFLNPDEMGRPEPAYPLDVLRCARCGLVLLSVVVRGELLFRHYLYASSASPPLLSHFEDLAEEVRARFAPAGALVVEIGSNDGVLLRPLRSRGLRAVGVEPAANLAAIANAAGLETRNEFFGAEVARRLAAELGPAATILGSNVLAHIDDLADLLRGLDALLDGEAVFVAEVPYLVDLLERVEYDTIYHEHLSYFSLGPLVDLFDRAGFELFDLRRIEIHGGSLRIYVARRGRRQPTDELKAALEAEGGAGLHEARTYRRFARRVRESREALRALVTLLLSQGSRLAGLGATAKGNTLLNYCGIGPTQIAYIADSTPLKHGLLTPGTHIPIRPESTILGDRPDYTLLLAWNYADAIVRRFAAYGAAGGRFIHPIPLARVIEA